MGNKSSKTIGDYAAMGLDLLVTCPRCGREAVFDASEVMRFWVAKGWPLQLPIDTRRLRCRCGARGGEPAPLMQVHRPEPMPPRPPALTILYLRRPSAVDVLREATGLASSRPVQTTDVRAALEQLAASVDRAWLDAFWNGAGGTDGIGRLQSCRAALNGILRQL